MSGLPRILHLSGDFPDPIEPAKTPVIRSLLQLTQGDFDHRVISLNRRGPTLAVLRQPDRWIAREPFEWGEAWAYQAPPRGIAHATMLRRLGDFLGEALRADVPDLLMGHKLTIEGIAVARAARRLGVPYGITIQGNTDTRILAARPDLAASFARVFHEAAVVFAFAPWALAKIEQKLGPRQGPTQLLPCPTDLDTPIAPVPSGDALVTAFHLRHHQNKNLVATASALRLLRGSGENTPFALIGGGEPSDVAACETALNGIEGATLEGPMERAQLRSRLNRGVGFVLASHRETFGLVFVEALFAGLPIIYPANRAVAGYFDKAPFAIGVEPGDKQALAAAMKHLVDKEKPLKQALLEWQSSNDARQFTRPQIAANFRSGLLGAARIGTSGLPAAAR